MKNAIASLTLSTLLLAACGSGGTSRPTATGTSDSAASCTPNSGIAAAPAQGGWAPGTSAFVPKPLVEGLPVIGILMYDAVLTTELTAPLDVFTKHTEDEKQLFNVITIAEEINVITSEEGLRMIPDHTLETAPELDVLIVPSAYDMSTIVKSDKLVAFIKAQNKSTEYTVSNCGGATLIGRSGIADGKKIVTWIGGGKDLQSTYPNLVVQDDGAVSYVEDGKFLSSNGNLATYISSLELLEKLSSKKHRAFVESYLYLDRLRNWKK